MVEVAIVSLVMAAVLVWLVGPNLRRLGATPAETDSLPYRRRDDFLSPTERHFLEALRRAVGENHHVLAKVRLADLVQIPRKTPQRWAHWSRVAQNSVDFVLCEPMRMAPVALVELDDPQRARLRRDRNEFVDATAEAIRLPLLRVPVKPAYDSADLAAQIQQLFAKPAAGGVREHATASLSDAAVPPENWVWGNPDAPR